MTGHQYSIFRQIKCPDEESTRSEATDEAYMYGAPLIVGMLIDYLTCIASKIVVLEMIALIKNEQFEV